MQLEEDAELEMPLPGQMSVSVGQAMEAAANAI